MERQHRQVQPTSPVAMEGNCALASRDFVDTFALDQTNLVRGFFPDERQYYLELVKHSRSNLMVSPVPL